MFDFRGVVFDVDPEFANSEEWYEAIPEDLRPAKDQPFYHLLAENAETATSPMSASRTWSSTTATSRSTIRRSPTCSNASRRPLPAAARAAQLT